MKQPDRDPMSRASARVSIHTRRKGAVVVVDPETGVVQLLDYAVAEDCGTMVKPMLVEGQIHAASCRASAPRCTRNSATTRTVSRSPPRSPARRARRARDLRRPSA
jgi:Molybdopterin-binding domain of aldehyde dehydrogenase